MEDSAAGSARPELASIDSNGTAPRVENNDKAKGPPVCTCLVLEDDMIGMRLAGAPVAKNDAVQGEVSYIVYSI